MSRVSLAVFIFVPTTHAARCMKLLIGVLQVSGVGAFPITVIGTALMGAMQRSRLHFLR
jgi:hypothetical protein